MKKVNIKLSLLLLISSFRLNGESLIDEKSRLPKEIVRLNRQLEKQRDHRTEFLKKDEFYDSRTDPFFKDKEVESHTRIVKTSFFKKKTRQIQIVNKQVEQLAPPSPVYTWYYEYYFEKDRLYAVCFRYHLKMQEGHLESEQKVIEMIVFFLPDSKPFAYRKTYPLMNAEKWDPMQFNDQFRSYDYYEKDETGKTTAALRDGINEVTKKK